MQSKHAIFVLCLISGCAAHSPAQRRDPAEASSRIQVGSFTQAQVKAVLGAPWRTTNYGESYCGCPHRDLQEVWEYRGADPAGAYKLHIEFDDAGIARTVAKIQGPRNSVTILASSKPNPAHEHQPEHQGHHEATE
jgi:hypothetical protein